MLLSYPFRWRGIVAVSQRAINKPPLIKRDASNQSGDSGSVRTRPRTAVTHQVTSQPVSLEKDVTAVVGCSALVAKGLSAGITEGRRPCVKIVFSPKHGPSSGIDWVVGCPAK